MAMQGKTSKLDTISQLYSHLSKANKKLFLKRLNNDTGSTKREQAVKKITHCPHCSSTSFTKNGKSGGYQRFICKDCARTFTTTNNTILFKTQKNIKIWQKHIHCIIEKQSLRKSAEICGISLPTAFAWRHKILDALQNKRSEVSLDNFVNFAKESIDDKEVILFEFIQKTECLSKSQTVANRPAVPMPDLMRQK